MTVSPLPDLGTLPLTVDPFGVTWGCPEVHASLSRVGAPPGVFFSVCYESSCTPPCKGVLSSFADRTDVVHRLRRHVSAERHFI